MKKNRLLRNENESSLSQYTCPDISGPTQKKALVKKCEKESESEGKKKSAVTFVTALFFLVAGTRISSISFRMDVKGGA